MKVFILATCRNPDLWAATRLVFDSLRVGFPSAKISVFDNGLKPSQGEELRRLCQGVCADVTATLATHWTWIRHLVYTERDPFWLCDTDLVFWNSMEEWDFDGQPLAGRYMPAFKEEYTRATAMPRLHTSLLHINPPLVREKIRQYHATIPESWFTFNPDLFRTQFIPQPGGSNIFYDTCSLLYQVCGGQSFTEEHLDCYDHLHAACSADIVGPHLTDGGMQSRQKALMENPASMKGLWRSQERYFQERSTQTTP